MIWQKYSMVMSHKLNIGYLSNTRQIFSFLLFNIKLVMITCNSYMYWFEPQKYLANLFTTKT